MRLVRGRHIFPHRCDSRSSGTEIKSVLDTDKSSGLVRRAKTKLPKWNTTILLSVCKYALQCVRQLAVHPCTRVSTGPCTATFTSNTASSRTRVQAVHHKLISIIFSRGIVKKSLKARTTSKEFISCHFPIVPTVSRHLIAIASWPAVRHLVAKRFNVTADAVNWRLTGQDPTQHRLILQPTSPPTYDQCQCAGLKQTQS